MLNGDTIERLKTEKIDSSNGSVEEMPKKKKTTRKTTKKRKP
jgi:hypothetical protein